MADATIFVVDDHEGARQSLRALLEAENFLVKDYLSAKAFLADEFAGNGDCLITDVRMPEMSGLELFEEVRRRGLTIPVIILTGHGDVPLAVGAMKAGAFDFIEKPYESDDLLHSVQRAIESGRKMRAATEEAKAAEAKIALMTEREREVFEHLVLGRSNKLVAHELKISPRTVEIHRARVLDKMNARGLSDLVRIANAAGISPLGAAR